MVEEQRFDSGLQQVDQVVMAADVRQFVRQYRFELFNRESGKGYRRE